MKKKIFLAFAAVFAFCFMLSGCGDSGKTDVQTADPTLMVTDYAEVKDGQFKTLYSYGSGAEEYVFWCKSGMDRVGFFPVGYDDAAGKLYRAGEATVVTLNVSANDGVLAKIDVPEVIPNLGIEYDACGGTFCYAIAYNGKDGGISLVPLERGAQPTDQPAGEVQSTEQPTEPTAQAAEPQEDHLLSEGFIDRVAESVVGKSGYDSIAKTGEKSIDGYECNIYTATLAGSPVLYIGACEGTEHAFVGFAGDGKYYYALPDEDGYFYVNKDNAVTAQ